MTRKTLTIKGREVDVPMTINQVYWHQYKSLVIAEINKGEFLTPLEVVIAFLGEDAEYWRSQTDVIEYIKLCGTLHKIYDHMKVRKRRTELHNILINHYIPEEKLPFYKRIWKRVTVKGDGISKTQIKNDDTEYDAGFRTKDDILYKLAGQYDDSIAVTSIIHNETDMSHTMEAWERLFKIYFYPIITGEAYRVEDAYQMNIDKVRWFDVKDFGSFFLIKLNRYPYGTNPKPPTLNTRLKKLGQDTVRLEKSMSLKG